ncbi:cytochrome P450 [Marasmius fiardii PR-910]|nr:cytochrome P450 [Marasmius fiardii PR-910]
MTISSENCLLKFFSMTFQTDMIDLSKIIYAVVVIVVIGRVLAFQKACRAVNNLPGIRSPFSPFGAAGAILGSTWFQTGYDEPSDNRGENVPVYRTHETISAVPWLYGAPTIFTSNLDVMKQVISTSGKASFGKNRETTLGSALYGENVLSTDGSEWRKHRRIMGPAFGNSLYQLVWEQSLNTYREMVSAEGWSEKKTVDVPVTQVATFKFALIVLGLCAFGFEDFNWTEPPTTVKGEMTVQEAMRTVIDNYLYIIFTPPWIQRRFPWFKRLMKAYDQLGQFMKDQVQVRRGEIRGYTAGEYTRRDAFSMLVQANESEDPKHKLEDSALIGNVFVMLFAGHETTAHTLAATLALLSLHEAEQDEVVQQIVDVVGYERDPAFDDYNSLNKVLGAFYEALRFFPAGYIMLRVMVDDAVIPIPNPRGQEGTQPCPLQKGTWVTVDMIGVHRNPRYFQEPDKYKPSRWHEIPNDSEQFTAFSIGSRACIGRKFATTEAVCFLTMFLRDWRVEPLLGPGETVDGWKRKVLDAGIGFTLAIKDVPLRLVKRERMSRSL